MAKKYAYFEVDELVDSSEPVDRDVVLYDSNDNVVERILMTYQEIAIGPEFELRKMGYEQDKTFEINTD